MARLSFVALCLAVAVLPGALSDDHKCRKGDLCDQSRNLRDFEKVWLFHFGPVDSREEYLNPLTGEVNGFNVDILNAVCEIAEKNCRIVYDLSSNCWDSIDGQAVGGAGLFNFYYDCCAGWFPTFPRLRTFQFSDSFTQTETGGFAVLPGNPDGFDPSDLTGKAIGFIQGFFTDPACIAMQGDDITGGKLSEDQIVFYSSVEELQAGLLAGEVDAVFDFTTNYRNQDEFDFLNDDSPIECAAGGAAVMCRKDNPTKYWFDAALAELLASNDYQEICARLEDVHGHKPGPDASDICL